MGTPKAERLILTARELDAEARDHKREASRHRDAARIARSKQAEIERQCAALGITVTYEPGEGDFHGHTATAARP